MTSKLIEELNKCETQKSYENVRYTLVDDELRDYIEESLERLEVLEQKDKKWQELFGRDLCEVLGNELLRQENEKLKKALEILKRNLVIEFNNDLQFVHFKEDVSQSYDYTIADIEDKQEYELIKEVLGE